MSDGDRLGEDHRDGRAPSIGCVILNYVDWQSTVRCAQSILRCDPLPAAVIIVDNASGNGSFEALNEVFSSTPLVNVLQSGRNGGYSFGNNFGIRYLRDRGIRHVAVATSDTEVVTTSIFAKLLSVIRDDVGAVGPQIVAPAGLQNPMQHRLNLKHVLDVMWFRCGMPGYDARRRVAAGVKSVIQRIGNHRRAVTPLSSVHEVYQLHGSFICLTNAYLSTYGGLDERLFMFGEEDLIALHCARSGLRQLLLADTWVNHADDASTDLVWGKAAPIFKVEQFRRSWRILRHEITVGELVRLWISRKSGPSRLWWRKKAEN